MRNIILAIESLILLVFCLTWCFCLQKNQDNLIAENAELKKIVWELRDSTERDIRVLKQDIKLIEGGKYGQHK